MPHSCCTEPRGYHCSRHRSHTVPKGSRASFKICRHREKGRLDINLNPEEEDQRMRQGRNEHGQVSDPTVVILRSQDTRAYGCGGLERAGRGGGWARSRRLLPEALAGGGWGRGRHLTARTNFSSLGGGSQQQPGQGESSAQLSPNGEVCKQKRGPRGSSAGGRVARFSGIRAADGEAGRDTTRGPSAEP